MLAVWLVGLVWFPREEEDEEEEKDLTTKQADNHKRVSLGWQYLALKTTYTPRADQ